MTSGGNSPSSAGIPLLPEKHCAELQIPKFPGLIVTEKWARYSCRGPLLSRRFFTRRTPETLIRLFFLYRRRGRRTPTLLVLATIHPDLSSHRWPWHRKPSCCSPEPPAQQRRPRIASPAWLSGGRSLRVRRRWRPHLMVLALQMAATHVSPPDLPTARLHLPPPWTHLAPEPAAGLPPPLHHQKVNPISPSSDGGYISVCNLASIFLKGNGIAISPELKKL